MTAVHRTWLAWSSGKDSAWSLHVLRRDPSVKLEGLLTTVNKAFDRASMHAVRREVLEAQAQAAGLPLHVVEIPWPCPNEAYERAMDKTMAEAAKKGITRMAFGDLFLEDIREYRKKRLENTPIEPVFPLWGLPTQQLASQMVEGGLEAVLTSVDPKKLPASFAGRAYDAGLLADLPPGVDPCGENGEFHTCVLNAPGFNNPIKARTGMTVERGGFVYCDVELDNGP